MTQEDKQLLLNDLCGRLPYGVKIKTKNDDEPYSLLAIHPNKDIAVIGLQFGNVFATSKIKIDEVKPCLRPMSSMAKEEQKEYEHTMIPLDYYDGNTIDTFDWLNEHHFDYRGLIEKGLALEAPEGLYN